MAGIATRRAELVTALATEGVVLRDSWEGEPPYAILFWDGSDLTPAIRDGQTLCQFRLRLVVAKAIDDVALSSMDTFVNDAMVALLAVDDWRIDSIGAVEIRVTLDGTRFYAVDIVLSTMITFS